MQNNRSRDVVASPKTTGQIRQEDTGESESSARVLKHRNETFGDVPLCVSLCNTGVSYPIVADVF